jgi:hypothetical protein
MLPPLIRIPRRGKASSSRERGFTMALVAMSMVAIISMAALSIDIGTLYEAKAEAQRAADAAALTAARFISLAGVTGATSATWGQICGGNSSPATLAAISMAQLNLIAGAAVASASVNVKYGVGSSGATNSDCSGLGSNFATNPVVTVSLQRTNLPVFFARVFSLFGSRYSGSSVSASATAEAFNPSSSSPMIPVQPRCVKPWMVPNYEPWIPSSYSCTTTTCTAFVDKTTGAILSPGVISDAPTAVIGQTFWLMPDCTPGATCALRSGPQANYTQPGNSLIPPLPNLDYLPAQASFSSTAVPSDGTNACVAVATAGNYAQAIAGCDQSTHYQCGQAGQNVVDLGENPATADTTNGTECLIHQAPAASDTLSELGQDTLQPQFAPPPSYPFQIEPGSSSPLLNAGLKGTDLITSSTSIVSLPIYDSSTQTINPTGTTNVTVIGFLQVFINFVDANGNLNVTVLNVSGCGNSAASPAVAGTSPVPIRLITAP